MDFELTQEQAAKLNAAMSGEQVELTEEQANIMNQAVSGQQQSEPVQPVTQNAPVAPQKPPLANPDPKVAMDTTGDQFWSGIVNRASMGTVPLAVDAVKGFAKDPMGSAQRTAQAGRESGFPLNPFGAFDMAKAAAGDETATRDYYQQAEDFGGPGTTIGGGIANPMNLVGGSGFVANAGNQLAQDKIAQMAGQERSATEMAGNAMFAGGAGKAFELATTGASSFDDFLVKKLGPSALDWVNKTAERVVMQGTPNAELVQSLKRQPSKLGLGNMFDDIKYQMITKLKPGILEDWNIISDRLAKQSADATGEFGQAQQKMTDRDALIAQRKAANEASINEANQTNEATRLAAGQINEREAASVRAQNEQIEAMNAQQSTPVPGEDFVKAGRFGNRLPEPMPEPIQPVSIEPQLQPVPRRMPVSEEVIGNAERASNLETIMAPGVNAQSSRSPRSGFATTVPGIIANNVIDSAFRRGALATMKTAQTVAQKALKNIDVDVNMAPFQKQTVMEKINAISKMDPAKANAYAYAESMVNPVFRQIWLNAQKQQETEK